jgi:hypothetical protein
MTWSTPPIPTPDAGDTQAGGQGRSPVDQAVKRHTVPPSSILGRQARDPRWLTDVRYRSDLEPVVVNPTVLDEDEAAAVRDWVAALFARR